MEFTQETITLIINGVFAFFIIMGFLFGISRGFKKSMLRFVFVASIAVVIYFAAPYISSFLLTYDFSGILNGMSIDLNGVPHTITTINDLITTFINSNAALVNFVDANPSFATLVQQLPTIVTNLAVFLLGFWALKILTWPIYAIMAAGSYKRKKDGSAPKRHRFAGGLMGVVQGAVIALVTFMPVAGVSSILNVEGTDGSGSTLLSSFLPPEIAALLPVYENSIMGKITNVGDVGNKVFDGLTTITVTDEETGEKIIIKPRQEAVVGMEIANDVQALIDMVTGIQDGTITEVDWDLLESLVNKVFDLGTIQLMIQEYAPYLVDELTTNAEYGFSEEIDNLPIADDLRAFLDVFVLSLDDATVTRLRTDALAIVNMGRVLDDHGIVDLFFALARDEILGDELGEQALQIFGTDYALSEDIMTALLGSESLRILMPAASNIALGYIEYIANEGRDAGYVDANSNEQYDIGETFTDSNENGIYDAKITIRRVSSTAIDWNQETGYLANIMYNLCSFAYSVDPFNMGDNVDTLQLISTLKLSQLGEVIDILRSTQLFGPVYESLTRAILTMPEIESKISPYVNITSLINVLQTTDWATEFNTVEQFIDIYTLIQDKGTLTEQQINTTISNLDSDLLELVIDGAVRAAFIEGFQENIGEFVDNEFVFSPEYSWLDELSLSSISSNADFFAPVIYFVMNLGKSRLDNITNADIDALVAAVQSVNNNLTGEELVTFKDFFNHLLHYIFAKIDVDTEEDLSWGQSISIDDLIDNIDTVGELLKLGLAISNDTILDYTPAQVSTLASEIAELDSMSPELITVLQGFLDTMLPQDENFSITLDIASINFATESAILEDAINVYLEYMNDGTFNATLAESILTDIANSYVAVQVLDAFVASKATDVEAPTFLSEANINWISDNAGLATEFANLVLLAKDNDLDFSPEAMQPYVSVAQVNALQAELDNMSVVGDSPEESIALVDLKAYIQDFINTLGGQIG